MSDLKAKIQVFAREAYRYLKVARLAPSLPLLLPLGPMLGALLLASGGAPAAGAAAGLVLVTLSLWGAAWTFNDLSQALRNEQAGSLILRGVLTVKQAVSLLIILVLLALLAALLLGWRFSSLFPVPLLVATTLPWLRRRTYLIEAWFGLGIAWTVPLAYGAVDRWPDKVGALLGVVTLLWAMGWKVLQQWPRHMELLERGVRSLGLMFGAATGQLVIAIQVTVLLGAWMAGAQASLGTSYTIALLLSAALIAWQSLLLHRHGMNAITTAQRLHLLSGTSLWLGVILHFVAG